MPTVARRRGLKGWFWGLFRRPKFRIVVETLTGRMEAYAAVPEHVAMVAHALMSQLGANAEAVVYLMDGRELTRVRRGA